MRMAILSWEALHAMPVGGVAVHVSALAQALAQRGNDVHLFTRRGAGQRLADQSGGVWVHRCPAPGRPVFLDEARAFAAPALHYMRDEETRSGAFAWLVAHDWPSFPAALAWAGQNGNRRLAVVFHSTEWGRSGVWPETGLAAEISAIEREACRKALSVLSVSGAVRRELAAQYHVPDWKSETVHHGVDPRQMELFGAMGEDAFPALPGMAPGTPFVLCVGRLDAGRGVDRLLAAWPAVAKAAPDAALLLAGDGPLAADIVEPAMDAPPEPGGAGGSPGGPAGGPASPGAAVVPCRLPRVWLAKNPDPMFLWAAYRACAALAAPARRDPYGQAVLCAWAAGRPVVASREAAPGEFVVDGVTGWLAGEDGWAEALIAALADRGRADWVGANGRAAVQTAFTWDKAAQKVEETLARCVRIA